MSDTLNDEPIPTLTVVGAGALIVSLALVGVVWWWRR